MAGTLAWLAWLAWRPNSAATRGLLATLLASLAAAGAARAGGGPENLFVVVNATSSDSIAVANAFVAARGIPPINVFMLPWAGSKEAVPLARFKDEILGPVLKGIDARRLGSQIDCIVYAADFPWRIDYRAALPPELAQQDTFPSGSLTGMTMLYGAVLSGQPAWLDPESNSYYRPLDRTGVPGDTIGFRSWYGWGRDGRLLEAGGNRYLLSVMLGVTAGRGNTVREVAAYLERAAAADGTRPTGTIYLMTNSDVRTTTRSGAFPGIVKALDSLGVKAEIASGSLPRGKRDVAGLMTGTPSFDWASSGSTILPGAICENLTSFGGIFTPNAGQTPLSEFLRAGAAGSSGTVIEPYSIQAKFPHAGIHVHYCRGASLAEAFYQSVNSPYQLLVVGDPLCQPWAVAPKVEAVLAGQEGPLTAGGVFSGAIEIEPRGTLPDGGSCDRFELFLDGLRVDSCGPGGRLALDTASLADGHHELRLVGIAPTAIETQGRAVLPVIFANHGRTLAMSVTPERVRPDGTVTVSLEGENLDGVLVFAAGRVLGRLRAAAGSLDVPAAMLGRGKVTLYATGRGGRSAAESVNALPVTVEVED
jgi:predicted small integral membrane protein